MCNLEAKVQKFCIKVWAHWYSQQEFGMTEHNNHQDSLQRARSWYLINGHPYKLEKGIFIVVYVGFGLGFFCLFVMFYCSISFNTPQSTSVFLPLGRDEPVTEFLINWKTFNNFLLPGSLRNSFQVLNIRDLLVSSFCCCCCYFFWRLWLQPRSHLCVIISPMPSALGFKFKYVWIRDQQLVCQLTPVKPIQFLKSLKNGVPEN